MHEPCRHYFAIFVEIESGLEFLEISGCKHTTAVLESPVALVDLLLWLFLLLPLLWTGAALWTVSFRYCLLLWSTLKAESVQSILHVDMLVEPR